MLCQQKVASGSVPSWTTIYALVYEPNLWYTMDGSTHKVLAPVLLKYKLSSHYKLGTVRHDFTYYRFSQFYGVQIKSCRHGLGDEIKKIPWMHWMSLSYYWYKLS